jgi:hypothetical protein
VKNDQLDKIIREIVSLHQRNYQENGERARSKIAEVKQVVERHINRVQDEN